MSLEDIVTPLEAYAGAGLLAEFVIPWAPTLEQPIPEELYPMEGNCTGAVHEELQNMGNTYTGEVCEGASPMGVIQHWSRGRVRRQRSDKVC